MAARLLAVALVAHLFGLSRVFRWSELAAPGPWVTDDYAGHFYAIDLYRQFRESAGQVWGYDPFFCAGYPAATVGDLSTKLWERTARLLAAALPFPIAFKLFPVAVALAIPGLCWTAAWGFRFPVPARATLTMLGTLYFWASLLRQFTQNGVIGFVLAGYGALAAAGLLWRWLTDGWPPRPVPTLALAAAGAALLMAHPNAPLLAGLPGLTLLAAAWRGRPGVRARQGLCLAGLAALAVLVNLSWLKPLWQFREFFAPWTDPHDFIADRWMVFKDYAPWGPAYWTLFPVAAHKWIRVGLLAAGAAGLWRLRRERWAQGVGAAAVLIFGLTYWGYLIPGTASVRLVRCRHMLDLLLTLPAAMWVTGTPRRWGAAAAAGLALAVMVAQHELRNPQYYVKAGLTDRLQAVVAWVKAQPDNGRILLEDSDDESGHQYDFTHVPALLPLWTGRAFIGGPQPTMYDRHHLTSFEGGHLSGLPIARYDGAGLAAYCRLYNITRVVGFSAAARAACDAHPGLFSPMEIVGDRFHTYAVRRTPSFVLSGAAARVTAGLNRIVVERPAGREVVLAFHWIKTLAVEGGGAILEPVRMGADPIPFIRLRPSDRGWPQRVAVVNAYHTSPG